VVILLRDVGLLKTTTYVMTNKYHILVSLVNLLGIYSAKGRIVSTSLMESILSDTSKLNRINSCLPISKKPVSELQKIDESCNTSLQSNNLSINSSIKNHELNPLVHLINESYGKTNDKNCKVTDKTCFNYSMNTDDLNMDVFFTTDCDFTILEKQNCLNHLLFKSILQTSKIQQCEIFAKYGALEKYEKKKIDDKFSKADKRATSD